MTSSLPSLGPRGEGWVIGQFALMALIGPLGLGRFPKRRPTSRARWAAMSIGLVLLAIGLMVVLRGARDLGRSLTPMPHPRRDAELVETGIYGQIRHPIYAGVILVGIGWATAMASARALLAAVLLVVWLDAKARREEAWLMAQFPGYSAYRARTRRFVPDVY